MVDVHAKKMVKKMHNFAPDFAINICFRSVKMKNIYAYTYKPKTEKLWTLQTEFITSSVTVILII